MPTLAWHELMKCVVADRDGHVVGSVRQVYLDDRSGKPRWVTVRTGFFGSKAVFVPLVCVAVKDGVIITAYTARLIRDSPSVDADQHIDAVEEATLYHYYDIETKAGLALLENFETLDDFID
ncbi:MAG: PRC-barrel domain-containing protein [Propionibacteriaceae bacterium]|jgi:sporulation protein YlmC with PRC-barrel domain|nr:PRC-barrel domain-containing protein [Propionibacteriaceae bacterium]